MSKLHTPFLLIAMMILTLGQANAQAIDSTGRIMLPVTLGGNAYSFVMDTGTGQTVISESIATAHSLVATQQVSVAMHSNVQMRPVVPVQLRVMTTRVNFEALVIPGEELGVDGAIGTDFLEIMPFMFTHDGRVQFGGEMPSGTRIPLEMVGNVPFITVTVGGRQVRALVDTGSTGVSVNAVFAQRNDPANLSMQLGPIAVAPVNAAVASWPIFQNDAGIVIGMSVWRQFQVVIINMSEGYMEVIP